MKKLNCILLIEDNSNENTYNKLIIDELGVADTVQIAESATEALDFIKNEINALPELIFLDLYMPKMDGWQFLDEYWKMARLQNKNIILVILSHSSNPDDINRAQKYKEVTNFALKPLTRHALKEIIERYF